MRAVREELSTRSRGAILSCECFLAQLFFTRAGLKERFFFARLIVMDVVFAARVFSYSKLAENACLTHPQTANVSDEKMRKCVRRMELEQTLF